MCKINIHHRYTFVKYTQAYELPENVLIKSIKSNFE